MLCLTTLVFPGAFGQSWGAAQWDWSLWLLFSSPEMQAKECPAGCERDK